jgi:hypothetical protein
VTARATRLWTAALAGLVAACGGASGDLIAIEVEGGFQREPVSIRITEDGRASCDRGPLMRISPDALLEARSIQDRLSGPAGQAASFGTAGRDRRSYVARMRAGAVRWVEGAPGLPPAAAEAVQLERALERRLCVSPR